MASADYSRTLPADEAEAQLRRIQNRSQGNRFCADCSHPNPRFINLTMGTFICDVCAGIHRATSKRRIKNFYVDTITEEDVHRMDSVGNDVANRKFLAIWDPREFPEPTRDEEEALREFIWLKYDGTFKKQPDPAASAPIVPDSSFFRPAPPPPPHRPSEPIRLERQYSRDANYYQDSFHRSPYQQPPPASPYRREATLFRDPNYPAPAPPPSQHPSRPSSSSIAQSYWTNRYSEAQPAPQPQFQPPPPPPQQHQQRYQPPMPPAQFYGDRYRSVMPSDRFQPPQHLVPYSPNQPPPRPRYGPGPDMYDQYATSFALPRPPPYEHTTDGVDGYEYERADGPTPNSRRERKAAPARRKSGRNKKGGERNGETDYYVEDEDDEDDGEVEQNSRRLQKKASSASPVTVKKVKKKGKTSSATNSNSSSSGRKKGDNDSGTSKKKKKTKKRNDRDDDDDTANDDDDEADDDEHDDEDYDDEEDEEDEEDDDDGDDDDDDDGSEKIRRRAKSKSKSKSKKSSSKRGERDSDSARADNSEQADSSTANREFDLMSDMMSKSKDGAGMQPTPQQLQQQQHAYQSQMPMMAPNPALAAAMYNSVMPGFIPMMPGAGNPFMPMPGALPPPPHPSLLAAPGPAQSSGALPGVVAGIQNLALGGNPMGNGMPPQQLANTNSAASGTSAPTPPPPPPLGTPAGPPPGPPPGAPPP